ncbi:type II toxin-antitoxin system HicA family toxin [Candidatus Spongiihabitans sp.]|uniref:type II toxin-antitoxin system HicA family toxin n=1 Tax=Candidatus Spongiihabitans sp. TaxID=3101308 RepID=UPI003C704D2A
MPFKYREFERKLTKLGYMVVRQKGSHVIFSDGKNTFPVPNNGSKDISPGVERQLLKILDLTIDEFRNIK